MTLVPLSDLATERITDLAELLVEAKRKSDPTRAQKALKKLMVLAWGSLPENARITFLAVGSPGTELEFAL